MLEHSRALLFAAGLTVTPRTYLEQLLDESIVAVSVDPSMPHSELAVRVLLTTLRRSPGILVLLSDGLSNRLIEELEAAVSSIDPSRPLRVARSADVTGGLRVCVGMLGDQKSIRIVPEGYGAHIAASGAVIRPARSANPLGAMYGAALGAAEVFKHTARVMTGRRVEHRHLQFCPVTLSGDLNAAPDSDYRDQLDMALIGAGAIGSGIALILSELSFSGRLLVADPERYGRENRGTYSLGGEAESISRPLKVDVIRSALLEFDVSTYAGRVEDLIVDIDSGDASWPPLCMTALDTARARRAAQRLWPDHLIDAGTGDTMLGFSEYRHGVDPCMMCLYREPSNGPSGTERVARALGLSLDLLAEGDTILIAEHLRGLSDEHRLRLQPHLGTAVCGLARATGLSEIGNDDYMPSVPFISLQAACLAVGRLIATKLQVTPTANFVQYDGLIGPQSASAVSMKRRTDCMCFARAGSIESVRKHRKSLRST
jgi:hypothetical protein